VRDQLLVERDCHRSHYDSIGSQIADCRKEYEVVEEKVRQAERELLQLSGYF
jgi:hypothetical protein